MSEYSDVQSCSGIAEMLAPRPILQNLFFKVSQRAERLSALAAEDEDEKEPL